MAKTKRFPNPLRSAPRSQCTTHSPTPVDSSHQSQVPPHTSNEAPNQLPNNVSLQTQSVRQVTTPTQAPTPQTRVPASSPNQAPSINVALQTESPSAEANLHNSSQNTQSASFEANSHNTPMNSSSISQTSKQGWMVELIDSQEVIKKAKLRVRQVEYLAREERIIVNFDNHGAAYGDAQGLLAGYLGTLAIDCKLFPINFERWNGEKKGLPSTYFEDCFKDQIKPRFCFRTTEAISKRYCKMSLGKKWASFKQRLWEDFYDPTKTKNEIIRNVPVGIDEIQWAHYVSYRLNPETKERCQKNKESRTIQLIHHKGGSKPLSRKRHEMFLETGKQPSRGELYLETHKIKEGSIVNDAEKTIMEQIEVGLTQSSVDESEISPNDVVGRVLGPEHSGRVRCMGMAAVPSNTFRNTRLRLSDLNIASSSSNIWQEKYTNLESQVENTLGALKAYMIRKEGRIPEEFVGIFGSSNANDGANEPDSPMEARGSSHASNI